MEGCEFSAVLIFQDFLITYKKRNMKCGLEFFNFIKFIPIDMG